MGNRGGRPRKERASFAVTQLIFFTRLFHMRYAVILLLAAFYCPSAICLAADWTEFRGSTGQGLSDVGPLPTEWDTENNVRWQVDIAGSGWSSPVVGDAVIYLTTAVPVAGSTTGDLALTIVAVSAKTGTVEWSKEVFRQLGKDAPGIHTKNGHASATPIVHEGRIYVHFGHQGTACLDLKGTLIWSRRDISYTPVHGNGGSPVLVDGRLIFSCDGGDDQFIMALDSATGDTLWEVDRRVDAPKKFSFSTPLAIEVNGKKQIVTAGTNSVSALDVSSGAEIWRVNYDGYSVVPRPVFGNGLVYVCTGFNTPSLLAIRPDGSGDVTDTHVAWSLKKGAPLTPSLMLLGDDLFMISDRGVASCIDAKTGQSIWQKRIGGNFSASPIHAAGNIYFLSEKGVGVVIRASRKFEKISTNDLAQRSLASYAVADRSLLIRTENRLYCIDSQ